MEIIARQTLFTLTSLLLYPVSQLHDVYNFPHSVLHSMPIYGWGIDIGFVPTNHVVAHSKKCKVVTKDKKNYLI